MSEINVAMGYTEPVWASDEVPEDFLNRLRRGQVLLTSGDATLVEANSDIPSEPFFVFKVNDQMYRVDGSSSSWGGTTYDSIPYPVTSAPFTKMVYSRL